MCLYFLTVNASAATPDEPDEKQETAEDVLAKVQWLKDNCAPTTKVKEYMSLTSKHRAEWVKDRERTVAEILEEFPRLLGIGMVGYYKVKSFQTVVVNILLFSSSLFVKAVRIILSALHLWGVRNLVNDYLGGYHNSLETILVVL